MALNDDLLRAIHSHGLDFPNAVQQQVIVPIVRGRDVIVESPRGSGKTTSFAIATLQRVDTSIPECQVLVLSESKDLALRRHKVCALSYCN